MKIKTNKNLLSPLLLSLMMLHGAPTFAEEVANPPSNLLTAAVAWKQTAAEFEALYYQGFNVARMQLDRALQAHKAGDRPLAIISDVDDTVLSSNSYWGYMINANKEFFDDAAWDRWVADNGPVATPGAVDFLSYAQSKGVEVFYVTSRDQGEKTFEYALANLRKNNLPFADDKHLTVYRDSSNKEPRQSEIAKDYDVVVMLGDNLNDFKRKYYVADVKQRNSLMTEDKEQFGRKFIIFPNPTDGHWLKAIFGDSEPPATPENRAKFKAAASTTAWQLKQ
ncbi:UNVERIFIED_ORG: 5'-nucleotidase (lipoprotein e(P4) family) [Pseudomonas reinekei]|uniref:5'-nucleotidase, lipoprotein e(P4) family n=1 Tax=Pseudomonas laurylsulfatiphila TaxID=2011015 RepID=A0A2S6FQ51_9PSED|nr:MULTISPECIES: 5'-nucleotidase, lipoprotein e(P4) family [Pseudomonas]EJM55998.1 5'-nucleotidase, lipoprotein e(P4) family [Pseudomonas sp. GM49]MDF9898131.1 5'-nucleotidase (lipoprotein e(P4) family) [Pseudomonas reinekei]PPK39541.1 5'-nucleotidase, lipoprotein e(P4) family [Pseudomonas laurylsulfatiphila]